MVAKLQTPLHKCHLSAILGPDGRLHFDVCTDTTPFLLGVLSSGKEFNRVANPKQGHLEIWAGPDPRGSVNGRDSAGNGGHGAPRPRAFWWHIMDAGQNPAE